MLIFLDPFRKCLLFESAIWISQGHPLLGAFLQMFGIHLPDDGKLFFSLQRPSFFLLGFLVPLSSMEAYKYKCTLLSSSWLELYYNGRFGYQRGWNPPPWCWFSGHSRAATLFFLPLELYTNLFYAWLILFPGNIFDDIDAIWEHKHNLLGFSLNQLKS